MMRTLEAKIGIELLARTTRSVSPTAAGAALLEDLRPALKQIERSLASARNLRERPAGKIRLVLSQAAARLVLSSKLESFAKAYPEIELDVTSSPEVIDIVAEGYDAGVHLGEFIERDMIAVRVKSQHAVGGCGIASILPNAQEASCSGRSENTPMHCLALTKKRRLPMGIRKRRPSILVTPHGWLTCSDLDLAIQAAAQGLGLLVAVLGASAVHLP